MLIGHVLIMKIMFKPLNKFSLFLIIMNVIKKEFDDIIARHPAKIPIIIQVDKELEPYYKSKRKVLVFHDYTASELMAFIRMKMRLPSNKGIFLFVDDKMISGSQRLYDVWDNKNRFMFVRVVQESVFGKDLRNIQVNSVED